MGEIDYDARYTKTYDEEAGVYDQKRFTSRRGNYDKDFKNEVILEILCRKESLERSSTVVDIAAGSGRMTHELAKCRFEQVVAIDISSGMLAVNKRNLPEPYRGRVEYKVMDMKSMDLPNDYADAVTVCSFFYLIPQDGYKAYTQDIFRILKPGGVLIAEVSTALKLFNPKNFLHVLIHRHIKQQKVKSHIYPWELSKLFGDFRLEGVIGVSYPLFSVTYWSYKKYSKLLGRLPLIRYLGGKYVIVLRKSWNG